MSAVCRSSSLTPRVMPLPCPIAWPHETSPYLLQHRRQSGRLVSVGTRGAASGPSGSRSRFFLSIGYSACHWCHVMEHESFENPAIAGLLNEHFVSIKVDREERPDLDQIYMNAVQMLTGRGGWPMSVFLTPDLQPFFGGTYWPPTARMGMPGFDQVLTAVADAWRERRAAGARAGGGIDRHIFSSSAGGPADGKPSGELSAATVAASRHGAGAAVRPAARRVRRRAEISASDGSAIAAATWAGSRTAARLLEMVDTIARHDGGRRNLRPSRRRVSSLFGRRALAGAAFRKNALRQRAAGRPAISKAFWPPAEPDMPASPAKRSITCCAT